MKNYALDTKLLPKVWITWESTKNREFDQRHWLNCQTGKKKNNPEPWMYYTDELSVSRFPWQMQDKIACGIHHNSRTSDKIWVKSGTYVRYAYAKYHADIDCLEVAAVGVDTHRKAEPHPWHFLGSRFFIGKDKSIRNQNGIELTEAFHVYEGHTAWNTHVFLSMLLRLVPTVSFCDELKKFVGEDSFRIGNGDVVDISCAWHLKRWFETSQKVKGKGKQQKLTDELTAIELSDSSDFAVRYPEIEDTSVSYGAKIGGIVYYEKVNDEWHVLRQFKRTYENELQETQRVYVCNNGNVRVTSYNGQYWTPSRYTTSGYWYGGRSYLANKDDAIANCDRIKYILTAADNVDVGRLMDFLVASLRFPEIEQISKLGYVDQMLKVVSSRQVKADLKYMFGGYYNEKEKSVLRKVGMTKHQFDTYMSCGDNGNYRRKAIASMRAMFGDGLAHIDNESFDKYFRACINMHRSFWRPLSWFTEVIHIDTARFFKNLARLNERQENVFQIVHDTLNAYTALDHGTAPEVDWYFDDVSDLNRAHDAVTELNRMQMAERRARYSVAEAERQKQNEEQRAKTDEKRKAFEYEDDKYIIRLPKDLGEIVKEGGAQRICIGGYASRHANGHTNLFFLRKKDNPDAPFYAIEMNNGKQILQIHGFCNKWLGNDPDAIPTVVRWLRKNDINCDEKILTCKATGYGRVNDYVAMPVVD